MKPSTASLTTRSTPCASSSSTRLPTSRQDAVDNDARLDRLLGSYRIEGEIRGRDGGPPRSIEGRATFRRSHGGRFVHEHFTLRTPEGELEGDAWIAWRPAAGRFELTQVDGFAPTTIWLTGSWDVERECLALASLPGSRTASAGRLLWDVRFEDDGSIVKELRRSSEPADPGDAGELRSSYRYWPE